MRSANFCSGVLFALATLGASVAQAGGPLYVVSTSRGLEAAHWAGTVQVYTDMGDLGSLGGAKATELVKFSLDQWSSVPTTSFRATVVGDFDDLGLGDITGSNAGKVIDTYNGGGVHVIYDHDGSVIRDFFGAGYGVLGIASPEFLAGPDSSVIVEGFAVINGQPEWTPEPDGGPVAGVITHELGHAFGLAHSQFNGLYADNQPIEFWGKPAGPEQAGPDQCGQAVAAWPAASQIETMYPMIDPSPWSPTYNSPEMAKVDVADDMSALSSLYPAPGYSAKTGTIKGRVVAKDGGTPLTGINVIARNAADPFDGISRISGDMTQGRLGPDGRFEIAGLKPGVSYKVYIDQIGRGGFSTPKAILIGPEEYWNGAESADASVDDACESTPIALAAGETRQIEIAVNGIPRAPVFTHIPFSLPIGVSSSGQRVLGLYSNQASPFWLWDKQSGQRNLGGRGFVGAIADNGQVIGGSVGVPVEPVNPWDPTSIEKAALWNAATGWKVIARSDLGSCDSDSSSVWDVSDNGAVAVGLAWKSCSETHPYRWDAKRGMQFLGKVGSGTARPNAVSGDGQVVGGFNELGDFGQRVGSLWIGNEQMLLRDPDGGGSQGYVGEVRAINGAGTIAVGNGAGPRTLDETNLDTYRWTAAEGVVNTGRYQGQVCYTDYDWETWEPIQVCVDRIGSANSISDDGQVMVGASELPWFGVRDVTIRTPGMGWMLLSEFLQRQGVLDASRWQLVSGKVSGNGRTVVGVGFPLAASDYWQGYKLDLDQVFVCHGKGSAARTLRVGFPDAMDTHLGHGDSVGFCPGDGPK